MAAENSFDVACKIDMQEVTNALDQARREIETRYDLKGSKNEVTLEKTDITILAADDMKLKAVVDILQSRLHKRGVPLKALTYGRVEQASGGALRQTIALQQGIPIEKAKEIVEPSEADILEAAKCYYALKRLLNAEQGDALMMECLTGLRIPHKHVPPCMGFMTLRDEGIVAGCQADLSSTLTMMLVEQLFDRPGFQQNAAMNTEQNLYFGSHCTCPSKMRGRNAPPEPYVLRNHAEAGWGCVPRVLLTPGQEVTMAQYRPGKEPQMHVYSGKVVRCPGIPPAGGCRTNVEMTIDGVPDVCDVKGMHQIIFYGNHARQLKTFCQLYGIPVVV